uniref:Uncharacterized protein n=1 Tax=Panagrolaimus sp. ES5 TaxID=591445 RepID=A0AC34G203_9BILA
MSLILFNGAGPFYTSPQSLTCDAASGQYLYTDTGGVQQAINSIECVCAGLMCNWNIQDCQIQIPYVGGPVLEADDSCIYQYEAYCDVPGRTMIQFYNPYAVIIQTRPYPPAIQQVTCPAGKTGGYYFIDTFGFQQTTIRCVCV